MKPYYSRPGITLYHGDCAFPGCECEDDTDPFDEEPGAECGRWSNGKLTKHCSKAGSEECDFECPLRGIP